jgi:hypothetical protein
MNNTWKDKAKHLLKGRVLECGNYRVWKRGKKIFKSTYSDTTLFTVIHLSFSDIKSILLSDDYRIPTHWFL